LNADAPAAAPARAIAALRLLRPHQWVKNAFVLVGVLFGRAWDDPLRLHSALIAFAAFCAAASAVYVLNDWFDRERDRLHPLKRLRPIASGQIGGPLALALALAMAALAWGLTRSPALAAIPGVGGGERLLAVLVLYVAMNVAYSLGLKRVPILDCTLISLGFMLRILAGTWAIGIVPSRWLIVCGLAVTLFIAFAKRRAELAALGDHAGGHRAVLEHYSLPLLDQFLAITGTAVLVTYSVYTVSADTTQTHGTDALLWTVPLVSYGLFRYLYLVFQRGAGGDPARDLVADPHLLAAGAAWVAIVLWVLRPGA
jgi:4-hydroxybenzoate polyprenyltransferase